MKIFLNVNLKLFNVDVTILGALLCWFIGMVLSCLLYSMSYISQCYFQDNFEKHIPEIIA